MAKRGGREETGGGGYIGGDSEDCVMGDWLYGWGLTWLYVSDLTVREAAPWVLNPASRVDTQGRRWRILDEPASILHLPLPPSPPSIPFPKLPIPRRVLPRLPVPGVRISNDLGKPNARRVRPLHQEHIHEPPHQLPTQTQRLHPCETLNVDNPGIPQPQHLDHHISARATQRRQAALTRLIQDIKTSTTHVPGPLRMRTSTNGFRGSCSRGRRRMWCSERKKVRREDRRVYGSGWATRRARGRARREYYPSLDDQAETQGER